MDALFLFKVLVTVSPFRPFLPSQPRVSSRNQPLLASSAPRTVNSYSILSTSRILPVATPVYPLFASSRHSPLPTLHSPFVFSGFRPPFLLSPPFLPPPPLFFPTSPPPLL